VAKQDNFNEKDHQRKKKRGKKNGPTFFWELPKHEAQARVREERKKRTILEPSDKIRKQRRGKAPGSAYIEPLRVVC